MGNTFTGRRLGPYQLLEAIGRGGMGVVYRARQPSVSRDVAIKLIDAPYARHAAFLSRFEREVQAVAHLQHPHILPVYDVGVAAGQPYLVMAYLSGGTLARRIAAHPDGLPLDEVVRLTAQIAAALDHAHRAGIIHCDLKPGNVLLDERGNAYLADFGLVRMAQEAGLSRGRQPGTPEYMAPEVAAGATPNPASDIYALGMIVFEMLTGRRPFQRDEDGQLAERTFVDPADVRRWRPDLPRGVAIVVRQALGASPESRPPQAIALAHALARAAGLFVAYPADLLQEGDPELPPEVLALTPVDGLDTDPLGLPIPHAEATSPRGAFSAAPHSALVWRGSSPLTWLIVAALAVQLAVLFVLISLSMYQAPLP